MKRVFVFCVVALSLGCPKQDLVISNNVVQVTGVVQDVRIVNRETVVRQGSSADDVIAGAILGKVLFDAPTTGAIVGAASAGEPTVRTVSRTDACMLFVVVDGVSMVFRPMDHVNNVYYREQVNDCALRKPGDVISVDHWFRQRQSGAREDGFRWNNIDGAPIPQG